MLSVVTLVLVLLVMALIAGLMLTYVWSSNAGRRNRAREMTELLLGRVRS